MERIEFKSDDYYEMLDEYQDLIDDEKEYLSIITDDGSSYLTYSYRYVIPDLHVSIREADWYALKEGAKVNDEDPWDFQASVFLVYDENEKDYNKWKSSYSCGFTYCLLMVCESKKISDKDPNKVSCFVEFD